MISPDDIIEAKRKELENYPDGIKPFVDKEEQEEKRNQEEYDYSIEAGKNEEPYEITEGVKKPNPFNKLHYSTEHLPLFHELNSLVGLYGRHYIPIIKARWYQLHGGILQKNIKLGQVMTDTRIHVVYPLPTEAGKNELIYSIKGLVKRGIRKNKEQFYTLAEPTSFHPEALIGKMVERIIDNPDYVVGIVKSPKKVKRRIENKGHLADDFVEFDECTDLITSNAPEKDQARRYLSTAENPIGKNFVEKRSVDDLSDEKVVYAPSCTNSYYFQPYQKIPESAILQGFLRRKIIPVGDVKLFLNHGNESLFADKIKPINFSEEDYKNNIIKHLETMKKVLGDSSFIFTSEAQELLPKLETYLLSQAIIHSEKVCNFAKVTKWSSLADLIKMACIISASYYSTVVDENAVNLAFMDLVELKQNTYDFVNSRVQGDIDYGTTWSGANFKQKQCLQYLYDKSAFSYEESSVSITQFDNVICEIYKIGVTQARNRRSDMKKIGLLDSKQKGQYDSRVWLKITPKNHKQYLEGAKGEEGYSYYNTIFSTKTDIFKAMQSLAPSTPLTERIGDSND